MISWCSLRRGLTLLTLAAVGSPLDTLALVAPNPRKGEARLELQSSVARQFSESGLQEAFDSAKIFTAYIDNSFEERVSKVPFQTDPAPAVPAKVLNNQEREALRAVLSEGTAYVGTRLQHRCIFTPELVVVFNSGTPERRYMVLICGFGHGEMKAFSDQTEILHVDHGTFRPAYLRFLKTTFPNHQITKKLEETLTASEPAPVGGTARPEEPSH